LPCARAAEPIGKWQLTGEMHERREYAGGVRLGDGRVLAVSGHPLEGKSVASAELFDPAKGVWTATGSLREARNGGNRATLLRDGRVLLAGGHDNNHVIAGAEVFDPAKGTWSDAGKLLVPRDPMATLLADGRVLASGGINWYVGQGKAYADCEIFDPATGNWMRTGSLAAPRYEQRTVLLDDGRVLAVGGYEGDERLTAHSELYDPAKGQWQAAADLPEPRAWFSLAKLRDGRVLVAGGYTGSREKRTYLASSVLYDPKRDRWFATQPMRQRRGGFAMALLADGLVLVSGGVAEAGLEMKSAELFDPQSETWEPAAPMNVARRNHNATLLEDGSVLVIGGSTAFGGRYLRSCEIFSR
jgi:N-acetylneuraminic acid mutarotase